MTLGIIVILLIYLLVGVVTGIVSGLFGLGGGVIVVPCLATIFAINHVNPSFIMHLAVGTSLAVMVGTTGNSTYQHSKKNSGYLSTYLRLAGGVIIGVIAGSTVGHSLHGHVLSLIFGVLVILIGLNMLRPKTEGKQSSHQLPAWYATQAMGLLIGFISALLGVGGGFMTVPYLLRYGISIHLSIMVSAMIALTVGILGTVASMYWGWDFVTLPKGSVGYVFWPACLVIVVGTLFSVPIGAKLAYKLPAEKLKKYFAILLLLIGAHMLF